MKIILFPDTLHFHERGFKSLMDLTKEDDFTSLFISAHNNLKVLYGNYEGHKTLFLEHYDQLKLLESDELFEKKFLGVSIFQLVKAEMLSYLMAKENWYNSNISSNEKEIFTKAYNENRETLLLNMAVSIFWLLFWQKHLKMKKYKNVTDCIVFSGSLIYVKTLSSLLQNTPVKVFVVEHFFTGNDYYFEEKYTHIANNSDIKFSNFYSALKKDFFEKETIDQDKDRINSINKINLGKNKNVVQPDETKIDFGFDEKQKTVLILGQVINDFSILETNLPNINSLQIYKNIILGILKNTNYNLIFKAHPWEKSKVNLKRSLTKDLLNDFIYNSFSKEEQQRFTIVEDFNLNQLFNYSDYIVALCSQSLLEASYAGKKTHQIGNAFFGRKGFTYDYDNEHDFVDMLINEKITSNLNLEEYSKLSEFFTIIFENHLVSVDSSGIPTLRKKLLVPEFINITQTKQENNILPSNKQLDDNKDVILQGGNTISINPSIKQRIIDSIVMNISSENKIKKFKSNPKRFFDDSNYMLVKLIGKIY